MKYLLILILLIFGYSCASYKGHNRTDKMTVRFTGGVYEDTKWDDTLSFKRTSFYEGAKLLHDVIITKIDKTSPFYVWMGKQRSLMIDCSEVFVALFYKDFNSIHSVPISFIRDQVMKKGFTELVVQNFSYYLRQHYAFDQWVLRDHKIYAYCNRSGIKTKKIHLTMPGYKRVNLLK